MRSGRATAVGGARPSVASCGLGLEPGGGAAARRLDEVVPGGRGAARGTRGVTKW
jgi:hypothetical protein